jgi:hypothetical protein
MHRLAIRLDLICNVVTLLAACFCVIERETIDEGTRICRVFFVIYLKLLLLQGLAGFALVYALQLPQILTVIVETSATGNLFSILLSISIS